MTRLPAPADAMTRLRATPVAVALIALLSAACETRELPPASVAGGAAAAPAEGTPAAAFVEAAWKPPTEAEIPNDSLGASIRRGLALLRFTPESLPQYAQSGLRCTSCHQNDGLKATAAPLTGSHARYPKYMPRAGAVVAMTDRINYCFTRSMAGRALPTDSREMEDLLAYMAWLSKGVPVGTNIAGAAGLIAMKDTLVGDSARGEAVFTRSCAVCHQADGSGNGPIPPLWGAKSYSIGASMSREERAASFIWHNMPQNNPGTLTPQEAFDVAAFVNSHPRPDSPGKEGDWPTGGAPKDVPYPTKGHTPTRTPARLLPRKPDGTIVPAPAPVGRGATPSAGYN
ncbi:MAG: c-type cytochrome [Gemmatimonadetes bacterium]|nr:c-type cytochrome [Gemmatimonadota bacterium]